MSQFTFDQSIAFKGFAEKSKDVFWVKSPDYKKQLYLSAAFEKIWGLPLDAIYAEPSLWMKSIYPEDLLKLRASIAKRNPLVNENTRFLEYYRIVRPDKGIRWIKDTSFPIFVGEQLLAFAGIAEDITLEKQHEISLVAAKEAAEAASQAKSEFITNMSHDIRTPLSGIVAIAGNLGAKARTPEEKEQLELMQEGAKQLLNLLNNVLDLAAMGKSHDELLKEKSFDLVASIKNLTALVLPNIQTKNLGFSIYMDPALPHYVIGDQVKFERILLNLLGNAIKFTEAGSVTFEAKVLTCNHSTCEIEWSISDTGIGIADTEQPKIFDRFFRVSPAYKGLYQGNGVGLYIAQKFVEQLGGKKIYVESKIGEGTRFHFTLPMKITETSIEVSSQENIQKKSLRTTPYHILLVEDTKIARVAAQLALEQINCQLDFAENGEAALRMVKDGCYELIFMDIGLPDISGMEVTRLIRREEKNTNKHIAIIGLSAHIDEAIRQEAYEAGMDDVLIKPLSVEQAEEVLLQFCQPDRKKTKTTKNNDISMPTLANKIFNARNLQKRVPNKKALRELLDSFIYDTVSAEIFALTAAYAQSEWVTVAKIAHRIKGGALYIDAPLLAEASEKLLKCCRASNKNAISDVYYDLLQAIDTTKIAVEECLMGLDSN